jgi:hypothetical protein
MNQGFYGFPRRKPSSSGGVTDGDKGDITVSAGGTVWTIDNNVVTFAKFQQISTNTLLGRDTAGTGNVEEITLGPSLTFDGSQVLDVVPDTTAQQVYVSADGVQAGKRQEINFVSDIGMRFTTVEDVGNNRIDVTPVYSPYMSLAGNVTLDNIALSATSYWSIIGGQITDNATETNRSVAWSEKGRFRNFYVTTYSAQSGTGALVLTLRVAAADTSVTVTIAAGSAAGVYSDTTNFASNAVGDRIAIKGANAATANSCTCGWTISHRTES